MEQGRDVLAAVARRILDLRADLPERAAFCGTGSAVRLFVLIELERGAQEILDRLSGGRERRGIMTGMRAELDA